MFSPDGEIIATATIDGVVRLWGAHSRQLQSILSRNDKRPNWYRDEDSPAKLPTAFTGALRDAITTGAHPLALNYDGKLLLTQTYINPKAPALEGITLQLWDLSTGVLKEAYPELPLLVDVFWSPH
ncbi:MAG TPA: WD40 repeat domain-containing protein, partial [Pyrinomonadaceae bacterium]|nr:WD40 repeat domain-containing protein [Pyrinomonadaceae bacterium]